MANSSTAPTPKLGFVGRCGSTDHVRALARDAWATAVEGEEDSGDYTGVSE